MQESIRMRLGTPSPLYGFIGRSWVVEIQCAVEPPRPTRPRAARRRGHVNCHSRGETFLYSYYTLYFLIYHCIYY